LNNALIGLNCERAVLGSNLVKRRLCGQSC
jgi:hypothetical protein